MMNNARRLQDKEVNSLLFVALPLNCCSCSTIKNVCNSQELRLPARGREGKVQSEDCKEDRAASVDMVLWYN